MSAEALSCERVGVRFGEFAALDDVSLDFEPGKIHSIIGPNGAGKTTLINVLSGGIRPSGGCVRMGTRDITASGRHRRAGLGIGRSFQTVNLFPGLSVFENLRLGAQARRFRLQPFWRPVEGLAGVRDDAERVLDVVGLGALRDRPAGELSHGDQRALELGLTLTTDPSILLLDEPLAGIGHNAVQSAVRMIREVARGRTVLLIEHNMDIVMSISDRIVVLVGGRVLAIGDPATIRTDARVRDAYLGRDGDDGAAT